MDVSDPSALSMTAPRSLSLAGQTPPDVSFAILPASFVSVILAVPAANLNPCLASWCNCFSISLHSSSCVQFRELCLKHLCTSSSASFSVYNAEPSSNKSSLFPLPCFLFRPCLLFSISQQLRKLFSCTGLSSLTESPSSLGRAPLSSHILFWRCFTTPVCHETTVFKFFPQPLALLPCPLFLVCSDSSTSATGATEHFLHSLAIWTNSSNM